MKFSSMFCGSVTVALFVLMAGCNEIELETKIADVIKDPEFGSITDPRDGIVYKTVKIGNQTWFAENLRYAGNIPNVTSDQAWVATEEPAWSNYDNNPDNDTIYGKLYNGFAVYSGNLCPPGWRIPTDADWKFLANFLGGVPIAGGKMKTVTGWAPPNTGGTNESGFIGLPGGLRNLRGEFNSLGLSGIWWTSSPTYAFKEVWEWNLSNSSRSLGRAAVNMTLGFSCRCLQN